MSLIDVNQLSFSYDTNYDAIFQQTSFQVDTDWKLGLIGRNGKGKTTLLHLLLTSSYLKNHDSIPPELEQFQTAPSVISTPIPFDIFPFAVPETEGNTLETVRCMIAPFTFWEQELERTAASGTEADLEQYGKILDRFLAADGFEIDTLIRAEGSKLGIPDDVWERSWSTLSGGEQVKLMLAALFLKKNRFLLIDEPTNHLDRSGREILAKYLQGKKSFILVSHDRWFLDQTVDHILAINRHTLEVQKGNYSTWMENKSRQDRFELEQNSKLKKEISRLNVAVRRTSNWSDQIEASKIGAADKGYVGHKSAKMMKRAKNIESRQNKAIEEKSQLLKDVEELEPLKMQLLPAPKKRIAEVQSLTVLYDRPLCNGVSFSVDAGERICLSGANGCGKSSLLHLFNGEEVPHTGTVSLSTGLTISYVPQDPSFLKGDLKEFAQSEGLDESLLKSILRKLDFSRLQFEKDLSELSSGQKKKILIARSLCRPANLFLWDEPLNYIDILSRSQIEDVILRFCPTLLFVEHDRMFCERISTKTIFLDALPPSKNR